MFHALYNYCIILGERKRGREGESGGEEERERVGEILSILFSYLLYISISNTKMHSLNRENSHSENESYTIFTHTTISE